MHRRFISFHHFNFLIDLMKLSPGKERKEKIKLNRFFAVFKFHFHFFSFPCTLAQFVNYLFLHRTEGGRLQVQLSFWAGIWLDSIFLLLLLISFYMPLKVIWFQCFSSLCTLCVFRVSFGFSGEREKWRAIVFAFVISFSFMFCCENAFYYS